MSKKCAIIFGANGISGIAMTKVLLESDELSPIICVSRRPPQLEETSANSRIQFVSIDMVKSSADELASKISAAGGAVAQHAYFYTYLEKQDPKEHIEINKMLLEKALNAVSLVSPKLKAFMLQTGYKHGDLTSTYKYYGNHLGGDNMVHDYPWKEDAPRIFKDNFYFHQEDLLYEYAVNKNWRWLVTRPNVILGVSKGNYMNFGVSIALYASLQKALGREFIFPGNEVEYNAVFDHSSADNNCRFQLYLCTNDKIPSGAFNICNNDKPKFSELWPNIANYFGLKLPEPLFKDERAKHPKPNSVYCQLPLTEYAKKEKSAWYKVAEKHGLDTNAYDYATWQFVDAVAGRTWPDEASMEKAKQHGWTRKVDTAQEYYKLFDELKEMNVIPK